MKNWRQIFHSEAHVQRSGVEQLVLGFLAGGAVRFGTERVQLHWTDHASLLLIHNARIRNRHLIVGVPGAPSTLGMLTIIRDTVMSMFSRFEGGWMRPDRPPEKVLWLAPKADMSQIFRRALFSANGRSVPLRDASNLVSFDLLEQSPATTTVAVLRDLWRVREALRSHAFAAAVVDDPFGQVCNTPQATVEFLQRIYSEPNHPPVVAIVPVRSLPDPTVFNSVRGITVWPWTADLSPTVTPEEYAASIKGPIAGSAIQRSQLVFDCACLLPTTIVVCPPFNPLMVNTMADVYQISARLAQEIYRSNSTTDRRLVGEARAAVTALEALCMPVTIHEAPSIAPANQRSRTITERITSIHKALFGCSPAIRDDLSILLDRIAEVLVLMKPEVPKWNRLVDLLQDSEQQGRRTAVAMPNGRVQAAMLKALQVQFPRHRDNLPWEICTTASVPRLGEIDELILVGLPSVRHSWLLRYPVCTDRKLLVWPFHRELGVWLSAPPLLAGAEERRYTAWAEVGAAALDGHQEVQRNAPSRVVVVEGSAGARAYYDIPIDMGMSPFQWTIPSSDEDDEDEETSEEERPSLLPETRERDVRDDALIVHHYVIHLNDGAVVYALEEDHLDVIKGRDVVSAAAATLEKGQELLMIRGQSFIKLRNMLMANVDRRYSGIWFEEDWEKWRQMCRAVPRAGKQFHELVARLRELGCDRDEVTIRNWLRGIILAPQDLRDIRRMALATGDDLMVYFSERFDRGMRDLRGRHVAFGKWLKRIVLSAQKKLDDREVIDPELDFTVGDLRSSVSRHTIVGIEIQPSRPPYRTGEVIKRREE